MPTRQAAVGVLLAVFVAACASDKASTAPTASTSFEPTATVAARNPEASVIGELVYAEASAESAMTRALDIYSPGGANDAAVTVLLHGGGADRQHSDVVAVASRLAEAGLVVFVPDHAVRGSPDRLIVDNAQRMREGVENVLCALRYAALHAPQHGGDPARITVVGQSAGGFLGMMPVLAGPNLEANWEAFSATRGAGEQVRCLADLVVMPSTVGFVGFNGAYFVFSKSDLARSDPEFWALTNPREYAVNGSARLAFLVGGNDQATPQWHRDEVQQFAQELIPLGYEIQHIEIAEAGHGWVTTGAVWETTLATILSVAASN